MKLLIVAVMVMAGCSQAPTRVERNCDQVLQDCLNAIVRSGGRGDPRNCELNQNACIAEEMLAK
jgi:carbamoylphosphate synthase small subunit